MYCKNCHWCREIDYYEDHVKPRRGDGKCVRFPEWVHIRNINLHFCGEWKAFYESKQ